MVEYKVEKLTRLTGMNEKKIVERVMNDNAKEGWRFISAVYKDSKSGLPFPRHEDLLLFFERAAEQ